MRLRFDLSPEETEVFVESLLRIQQIFGGREVHAGGVKDQMTQLRKEEEDMRYQLSRDSPRPACHRLTPANALKQRL